MKIFDNRTNIKDHKNIKKTNVIYDHNSISTIKKIKKKSNSYQIKPKQNSLTYTSLEKNWDRVSM